MTNNRANVNTISQFELNFSKIYMENDSIVIVKQTNTMPVRNRNFLFLFVNYYWERFVAVVGIR